MDPLTDFARWGRNAPFLATRKNYDYRAMVVPVQSKTGLVASRRGGVLHLDAGIAAVFEQGQARFGARFLCAGGTINAAVVRDAGSYGYVICELCVDAKLGPGVYHCFGAGARLLYIGSSKTPLKRQKIHQSRTPWWPEVENVRVTRFPTEFEARAAERLAIDAELPPYNKPRYGRRNRSAA